MAMDLNGNSYYQSIRFTPDGFCLYLHSENNTELCKYDIKTDLSKNVTVDIQTIFQKAVNEIGFDIDKETKIIYEAAHFCCAPEGIFEKEDCLKLLQFQHCDFDNNSQVTLVESLNERKIDLFYSVDKHIYEFFNTADIKLKHCCQIGELILNTLDYSESVVYCNLSNTECEIAAGKNQELLLVNKYNIYQAEDIVYTILNVAQTVFETNLDEVKFIVKNANLEVKNFCLSKISNIQFN